MLEAGSKLDYHARVRGGWLGKNIGGTLGAPNEGERRLLQLRGYTTPFLNGPLPNDDLDLQLLWLSVLERHGLDVTSHHLAQAWLEHVRFPFNEYAYGLRNLRRGLLPPVSGSYDNPFINGMGSPIRTEVWAMVAHGRPEVAAALAYEDAIVDHADEGVWGSMFFAALEALAFGSDDRERILNQALSFIPDTSAISRVVCDLRSWHRQGLDWITARENILASYGNYEDFTDAPQNVAFAVLGWLYGDDFGDALLKTVNCGFDTDSSGAMVGALLGILGGAEAIPEVWAAPIGELIAVNPGVGGFPYPRTLSELTERTCYLGERFSHTLADPSPLGNSRRQRLSQAAVRTLWTRPGTTMMWSADASTGFGLEVSLSYQNSPALAPHEPKQLQVTLENRSGWPWEGRLEVTVPADVALRAETHQIELAPGDVRTIPLTVSLELVSERAFIPASLVLTQTHAGLPWRTQTFPVTFTLKTLWHVWSPAASLTGGPPWECFNDGVTFDLARFVKAPDVVEPGIYTAKTQVRVPSPRPARLTVFGKTSVEVLLGGAQLFVADATAPLMPSPHMTRNHLEEYSGCYHDIDLTAGVHELTLRFKDVDPAGHPTRLTLVLGSLLEPLDQHFIDIGGV